MAVPFGVHSQIESTLPPDTFAEIQIFRCEMFGIPGKQYQVGLGGVGGRGPSLPPVVIRLWPRGSSSACRNSMGTVMPADGGGRAVIGRRRPPADAGQQGEAKVADRWLMRVEAPSPVRQPIPKSKSMAWNSNLDGNCGPGKNDVDARSLSDPLACEQQTEGRLHMACGKSCCPLPNETTDSIVRAHHSDW